MSGVLDHWVAKLPLPNLRKTNSRAAGGFTLYRSRNRFFPEEGTVAGHGLRQLMDRSL